MSEGGVVCVVAVDLPPGGAAWEEALRFVEAQAEPCGRVMGLEPRMRLASLALDVAREEGCAGSLAQVLREEAERGAAEVLLLPGTLDLSLFQRQVLAELAAQTRKGFPGLIVCYDDADPGHPLVVRALADRVLRAVAGKVEPGRLRVLLAASGHGDAGSRAQSYRLMRLVWEELSAVKGEVAFLRHASPFLAMALERCAAEGGSWAVVPQVWWGGEHAEWARTVAENGKGSFHFVEPVGASEGMAAWVRQRILALWRGRREREVVPSARRRSLAPASRLHGPDGTVAFPGVGLALPKEVFFDRGLIAEVHDAGALGQVVRHFMPEEGTVFIKVTWHGYAPGTYTDPVALRRLLEALRGRAVLVEGHTSSRNLGGATWDWETEAREHRGWIQEQEMEYLRRTGLAEVIADCGAQYVNVTEAWWDRDCVPREEVEKALGDIALNHPELLGFVPRVLFEHRGAPFVSFARLKGPTRGAISNLFGLIPEPLRAAWHGPNVTFFASVCCDLARLYGALFRMVGMVEGLHVAVRWDRQGLHRSRWGNYDLIPQPDLLVASAGLAAADVLASRLQGGDPGRSGFFDVVRQRLGWPEGAASVAIPEELVRRLG